MTKIRWKAKLILELLLPFTLMVTTACSATKQLEDMNHSTDHMDKSTTDMNKNLTQLSEKTGQIVDNSKGQSTDLKAITKSVTDLTQTEQNQQNAQAQAVAPAVAAVNSINKVDKDLGQLTHDTNKVVDKLQDSVDGTKDLSKNVSHLVDAAQAQNEVAVKNEVLSIDNWRSEKKLARDNELWNLKSATNKADLTKAAENYVCDFEFRYWSNDMSSYISEDDISALGLKEYLETIGAYLLKQGVDDPLNVFAEDNNSLAQLNTLVRFSKFSNCQVKVSVSHPGQTIQNKLNFYDMITSALIHAKSQQTLNETDKTVLSDLKPAAVFVLQAYHNLLMASAIKSSINYSLGDTALFALSKEDGFPSFFQMQTNVAKLFDNLVYKYGKTWQFDLSRAPQTEAKNIEAHAASAVRAKDFLKKEIGIQPEYDQYLTTLIKDLRPAPGTEKDGETKKILGFITQQYLK